MKPPAEPIPVEVLPPEDPAGPRGRKTFYHPASGLAILGIDVLAFGSEAATGFLDTPLMCVLAFFSSLALVYLIQTRWAGNGRAAAWGKAFLGAFLAGLPFSIAGTLFGAAILALAGLPHPKALLRSWLWRRVAGRSHS
ncbi:MAG: hypothetical protein PW734_00860 [Verrucomicrobium sp.]|nr:hypothetical protein [Verrucomicrobium sp.]